MKIADMIKGAVLGCAYLGSTNGEESADLTALLEGADCLTAYPFLREIPAEQVVAPGGWDIYCICLLYTSPSPRDRG